MLRRALTPRWLVAGLVLVLFVLLAIQLGRWQWDRTQTILAAERAAAASPVPVGEVLTVGDDADEVPAEGIGRPVTVTGRFDADLQSVVVDRLHEGAEGVWIVTGLRQPDDRVVAVLRGSLSAADAEGIDPPDETVTVTGVLQPDETFYADALTADGTVASIAHDRLARDWGVDLLPGYVVLTAQSPASPSAPSPVPPTVQTADVPFPLQNFFYAFQWWLFALFAVVVYLRWLWLDSRPADTEAGATA